GVDGAGRGFLWKKVKLDDSNLPTRIVAGRLTHSGPGDEDLAVLYAGSGRVLLLRSLGGGDFSRFGQLDGVGTQPSELALGDVNGDDVDDLVITDGDGGGVTVALNEFHGGQFDLRVFRVSSGPTVVARDVYRPTARSASPIGVPALIDVDKDKQIDLIV